MKVTVEKKKGAGSGVELGREGFPGPEKVCRHSRLIFFSEESFRDLSYIINTYLVLLNKCQALLYVLYKQ